MMISDKLSPELHQSTYNAYEKCAIPVPEDYDRVVFGFERQTALVAVGVEAVIQRALKEGHDMIVEGIHLVPGYIPEQIMQRGRTFAFMLSIDDVEAHRQRFYLRSLESDLRRRSEHYLAYFEEIRKIQEYLCGRAGEYGVRGLANDDADYTVELIMESLFGERNGE
jgi:2-phosphoglycerate kinase